MPKNKLKIKKVKMETLFFTLCFYFFVFDIAAISCVLYTFSGVDSCRPFQVYFRYSEIQRSITFKKIFSSVVCCFIAKKISVWSTFLETS